MGADRPTSFAIEVPGAPFLKRETILSFLFASLASSALVNMVMSRF
jgi:hypothetical protein